MNRKDKMIIMMTVLGGSLEKVRILFEKYKIIKDESYFDYELLKRALSRKDYPIIEFLIKENLCRVINPNKKQDTTPLHLAVFSDKGVKKHIITALIKRGASIYSKNEENETVLFSAFKHGQVFATDILLDYSETKDLDPADEDDRVHFYIACVRSHYKTINLFLKKGFVNSPFNLNSSKWIDIYPKFYDQDERCSKWWGTSYCHYYNKRLCLESPDIGCTTLENSSELVYFTPLHFSVRYGFKEIVKLLLKHGADCNRRDKDGRSPLHLACRSASWNENKIIDLLLKCKASTTIQDNNGRTPLHIAFYNKNGVKEGIFDTLLSQIDWSSNYTDEEGLSYFHIACAKTNASIVKYLLNSEVNMNGYVFSGNYKGFTALHFAVSNNQKEIVELLLNRNADVNTTTNDGFTPLHLACKYFYKKFRDLIYDYDNPKNANWSLKRSNQLDIIKGLIAHGADIGAKDKFGRNPLHHVCKFYGDKTKTFKKFLINEISMSMELIIKMFLSRKEDYNTHKINSTSILQVLSRHFDFPEVTEKLVKFLLTEGADLCALDDTGLSPLHIAVQFCNKELVQTFLDCNVNVNVKCKDSIIPLEMIINNSVEDTTKDDIICMLLEYGSDVNIINEDGKTMLHTAIIKDCPFIVKKLLYYGADINHLEDLSIIPKKDFITYYYEEDNAVKFTFFNTELFKIIFIHVQKLLMLGLHVNENIQRDCHRLYSDYCELGSLVTFNNLDVCNYFKAELNRLKLEMINNYTSLYSILLKDPHDISKYARNSSAIEKIMDENIEEKFPFYGKLLQIQFEKGIVRRDALKSAIPVLNHVINFSLPESCCDLVLKFLTNEEVVNLKSAIYNCKTEYVKTE